MFLFVSHSSKFCAKSIIVLAGTEGLWCSPWKRNKFILEPHMT